MEKRFSIVESLRFAFYIAIEHIVFFIGIIATYIGILIGSLLLLASIFLLPFLMRIVPIIRQAYYNESVSSSVVHHVMALGSTALLATVIVSILMTAIDVWLNLGLLKVAFEFHDLKTATYKSFFSCAHLVFRTLMARILYCLIVMGGLMLFIVPGIIWSIQFGFYNYCILDKNAGILESLRMSSAITDGAKKHLLGFNFIIGSLNLLAVKIFGLGLFITLPVSALAGVYVYRKLVQLPAVR